MGAFRVYTLQERIFMTTDELIDIIVKGVGIKLPYYDYEYKSFIAEIPVNLSLGGPVVGIGQPNVFDTYYDACMFIYKWAVQNNVLRDGE